MDKMILQRLRNAVECLGLVLLAIFLVVCLEHVFSWTPSIDAPMRKCVNGIEHQIISDGNGQFVERILDRQGKPVSCTEK